MSWSLSKTSQAFIEDAAKTMAAHVAREAEVSMCDIEVQLSVNMSREFQIRINAHRTFNTEITITGEPAQGAQL